MKLFENEIIIIGGNHHNMLGVVRSLGIKGYKSTIIVNCNDKFSFVSKSKYVKKAYITTEDEKSIMDILDKNYTKNKNKAIIIPTSDFAAYFIDKNYNKLNKYFILPSINNQKELIIKYMDKYNQYILAKKYDINMASCKKINLKTEINFDDINFGKCIIKPLVSAKGKKSDIKICESKEQLISAINQLKKLEYEDVLIQEYLDFDLECGIIGCIDKEKIIIPGIIKKERIYPVKRGSNSYSHIEKIEEIDEIEKIKKLLCDLNYSGMFDIEIFIKNNQVYLNEINFRNSGNTFAYCYDNIFIIYLWILMKLGIDISKEKKIITEKFDYIDEKLEIKQLLARNITLREYLKTRKKSKARLFGYKNDNQVKLYKIIYTIRKRIKI